MKCDSLLRAMSTVPGTHKKNCKIEIIYDYYLHYILAFNIFIKWIFAKA